MKLPDFRYEKEFWEKGFRVVAGADEVGRGAWAGPLVASAVVLPSNENFQFARVQTAILNFQKSGGKINDSKKLSARQREKAAEWIKEHCLAWGIGEVGSTIINRVGMARASKMVFRQAIFACNRRLGGKLLNFTSLRSKNINFLLVDAFYVPYTKGIKRKNQLAIIRGDEKSFSIASASIIAKVYRDNLMCTLSKKHKEYGWERNKGYGTQEHQKAILRAGITRLHRTQFVKKGLMFKADP